MEQTCTYKYKSRLSYKAKIEIPPYPTDYPQNDLNLVEIVGRDHFGSLELISTNSPTLPFSCLPLANIEQEGVLGGTWDPQVWSKSWSLESSGHIAVIKPPTFVGEILTVNEQIRVVLKRVGSRYVIIITIFVAQCSLSCIRTQAKLPNPVSTGFQRPICDLTFGV